MTPDTAELAIAEERVGLTRADADAGAAAPIVRVRRSLAALRADPARISAVRDSWQALWSSRVLIWAAALVTLATYGFGPTRHAFNPRGLTRGLGWLGNALAAPAARWDGAWYLVIAHYGYRPDLGAFTASRDAFFPLYPLGLRALATIGVPLVLGGVLLSTGRARAVAVRHPPLDNARARRVGLAGVAAPVGVRRRVLAARGRASGRARDGVRADGVLPLGGLLGVALPAAVGRAVLRGAGAGSLRARPVCSAALAGATRSAGIVLVVPALILYFYGPRADRAPDFARVRALAVRYRARRDVLWLALAPAGLALYMLYLALAGGDALAPFHAQEVWGGTSPDRTSPSGTACGRGVRGRASARLDAAEPRLLRGRRRKRVRRRRAQPAARWRSCSPRSSRLSACCARCRSRTART